MHTIREFTYTASDYQALADLFEAVSGNIPHRPEDIQHMDKIRGPEIPFERFVAEADGNIIAEGSYGQSIWFGSADKLNIHIATHPDVHSEKLMDTMVDHLVEQAATHHPQAFTVRIYEDDPESTHFWTKHGFQHVAREPRFALNLIKFSPMKFNKTISNVENQGIEFHALTELKSNDPVWLQKWWQMERLILQDLATEEAPAIYRTLDQFEQDIQHPAIIPDAFFFAVDNDQYIAIAGLTRYDEITYMADLTWALPSYHARDIELALKIKTINWAIEQDATYIIDEAPEDDPIYNINLKLGFEHLPAWLVYEKHL